MDLQLAMRVFDYSQRRKKWVLGLVALGFTGYGVYKVYQLPSVVEKRKRLFKFLGSLISIAEMIAESGEVIGIVSKDLRQFMQSDSDKIPNSLRQISKVTESDEFSESVVSLTRAITVGILRGYRSGGRKIDSLSSNSGLTEQVLDKLFTTAGSGFASLVVGSFARNVVMGFCLERNCGSDTSFDKFYADSHSMSGWVDALYSDKCRELIGDCVQLFVTTAVAVYLDKTMHINTYDQIFSGITNPKHEAKVKEVLTTVCKGTLESLVRTSHQVLTNADSVFNLRSTSCIPFRESKYLSRVGEQFDGKELVFKERQGRWSNNEYHQDGGLMTRISSVLAVPSNRRFVLDVTGVVTFETVRSVLEFLLEKISDALRTSIDIIREEVVDKGTETVRYMTIRSSTVVTVCLSLCLHVLGSPWLLVPA